MYSLSISDMTCSHCAGTVEKAVKSVDPNARVTVDLLAKTAGSSPTLVSLPLSPPSRMPATRRPPATLAAAKGPERRAPLEQFSVSLKH